LDVKLEIGDGLPRWWLSPEIWTVPNEEPTSTPGLPIVGQPCYIWARVRNNGKDGVENAYVRFYWANPAVGIDRKTANYIGTSNVSLESGEARDVLCLTPWNPTFVNNGHVCVVAEASHPYLDPITYLPQFNVPTDRHVAQRNLTIIKLGKVKDFFTMNFEICNALRLSQRYNISCRLGNLEEISALRPYLDPNIPKYGEGTIVQAGFVSKSCPDEDESKEAESDIELEISPGSRAGLSVVGVLEGDIALLHVVQSTEKKEIGGLSILVYRDN